MKPFGMCLRKPTLGLRGRIGLRESAANMLATAQMLGGHRLRIQLERVRRTAVSCARYVAIRSIKRNDECRISCFCRKSQLVPLETRKSDRSALLGLPFAFFNRLR